jgi:hypothetical protein
VTSDPLGAVRWIDVILVIALAPIGLLLGVPVLGYVAATVGWAATRIGGEVLERRARESDNPKTAAGLMLFTGLGRAWAMGLIIVVVGVAGAREDGLTAAVTAFLAFSVYLGARVALGPQRRKPISP